MGPNLGGGQERILLEVEHVKAHHSKKVEMTSFEIFVIEGNQRADELAHDGAMLDGGEMGQLRVSKVQQARDVVYAALQYAASFHCMVEECAIVKSSSRRHKESGSMCTVKGRQGTLHGVACSQKQIPLLEMRKEQQ